MTPTTTRRSHPALRRAGQIGRSPPSRNARSDAGEIRIREVSSGSVPSWPRVAVLPKPLVMAVAHSVAPSMSPDLGVYRGSRPAARRRRRGERRTRDASEIGVYPRGVDGDRLRRDRNDVTEVARSGPDWVSFAIEVTDTVQKAIPFDRCHWHTVGPGTVLFTGSANRDVSCSGTWLLSTSTPSRTWISRVALASDPRSPMGSATSCEGRSSPATPAGAPPPSCATATGPGPQKTTYRAHLPGGRALDRPAGRGATTRDAVVVEDGPVESTPQVP